MNLQGFLGVLKRMAFWAAVSECVWIVFAFNVVSNIDNSLVGELQADTTGWHPAVIADHKFDEFFWARESSLKKKLRCRQTLRGTVNLKSYKSQNGLLHQYILRCLRSYESYGSPLSYEVW